ncbi:MAG: hypothetical protein AAFX87_12165 [Bacteroidota bacterium]
MRNLLNVIFLAIALITVSCQSNVKETKEEEATTTAQEEPVAEVIKEDSVVSEIETPVRPPFIIDSLFDLKAFKTYQRSSHSSPVGRELPLFKHENGGYYSYFFFTEQRRLKHESGMEFPSQKQFYIITATKKPIGKDYYLTIEETLVLLQSSLNDPSLGQLDLVGKSKDDLTALLGSPIYESGEYFIYGSGQHIITSQINEGSVKAFKYMYLKSNIEAIIETNDPLLRESILSFKGRS